MRDIDYLHEKISNELKKNRGKGINDYLVKINNSHYLERKLKKYYCNNILTFKMYFCYNYFYFFYLQILNDRLNQREM